MAHALICDLDNTLFPSHAMPASVLAPVRDAIVAANTGSDAVAADVLQRALDAARNRPFDVVAEEFHLPERMRAAWAKANAELEVAGPLTPYDDVDALALLALPRFLVTTGFRRPQESKIAALGIGHFFDAIYVDALDEPEHEGKGGIFRRIVAEHGFAPGEVLVVGDSVDSELRIGRELGMVTIQVLRDDAEPCVWVSHCIRSLYELVDLAAA